MAVSNKIDKFLVQSQLSAHGSNISISKFENDTCVDDGELPHAQCKEAPYDHQDVKETCIEAPSNHQNLEETYESLDSIALQSPSSSEYAEINNDMWNDIFPVPAVLLRANQSKRCRFQLKRARSVPKDLEIPQCNVNISLDNNNKLTAKKPVDFSIYSHHTPFDPAQRPKVPDPMDRPKYKSIRNVNDYSNRCNLQNSDLHTTENECRDVEDNKDLMNGKLSALKSLINFNCLCHIWIIGLAVLGAVVITVVVGAVFYKLGTIKSDTDKNAVYGNQTNQGNINETCRIITGNTTRGVFAANFNLTALLLDNRKVPQIITANGRVTGDTSLNDQLFVVRDGLTVGVDVYNTNNFTLLRSLTLPNSARPWAIVAHPQYNCLYMSDPVHNVIYLYNLTNDFVTNWTVNGKCYGLSLTRNFTVLATLYDQNRLDEYTPGGCYVTSFYLDNSIQYPYHSVQLSNGLFGVVHQGADHIRVCTVDGGGSIIHCFGNPPAPWAGQQYLPALLTVDINNNLLVTDTNRAELLNQTVVHIGYIHSSPPTPDIRGPYAIHFNEINGRLYIGEWWGNRIFVFG